MQSSSSRTRREITSIYSQLPLPPTPPTTPPEDERSDLFEQPSRTPPPPSETTPTSYSFPTFPGRPSPASSRRSPPLESFATLDLESLTAEDASTRYLSLTPAQLKESRYSVFSNKSTTSQLSDASSRSEAGASSRGAPAQPTFGNRSLPSRPTLSPRSALVHHSNLDLSFLDGAPPAPSTPSASAPFPRRPVARFPAGRSNSLRGNKDITSRIMSTASMYSNTSLDSLEEETKRVMKSIAVHPARQHQTFSAFPGPRTNPATGRITFPARRIRATLRNSIDSLTRPTTPPLDHHVSEPATPISVHPPSASPKFQPSASYFEGRRRSSLDSIGSSFVSGTTGSIRTMDSDTIFSGLPLHLSASTLQRPWKRGSDSSLSLADHDENAEDRSRLRNSCSRRNSVGSLTSSEESQGAEEVESTEKEDRRKTMYYSPEAGWSDDDDDGEEVNVPTEFTGNGLGLDPAVQDSIVLSMQHQLNLLAPSQSPDVSPRNSTVVDVGDCNPISRSSTFPSTIPSTFPSRGPRNPEAAEKRKKAIQQLMVAEATYAADLRAIYLTRSRGIDLAAIADHCLNSEPPVESPKASTGRYSGTFNVNTASVLPRQARRVSTASIKIQSRSQTPTNPSPAPPKLRVDPVKSANVILEIIETEKSYVRGLVELSELYIIPTAVVITVDDLANGSREESFIPEEERNAVFGNIETIREFHQDVFLPELITAASSTIDPIGGLARVFTRHSFFLEVYSLYVTTFDTALARLAHWGGDYRRASAAGISSPRKASISRSTMSDVEPRTALTRSQSQRIELHMKLCRASPSHSQISLEAYLLLPVQRVPRYRMLLESLIASTPQILADGTLRPHKSVQEAYDLICGVAMEMNERKRESEGLIELVYVQKNRGGLGQRFRAARAVSTIG